MRGYENPEKTSENRLEPRSYYIPEGVAEYWLLNGIWRFRYFSRDIDVPETIEEWEETPVPSCWQMQGYENPNYTNINYPFPCDPPYVPDDNPCPGYMNGTLNWKNSGEGSISCWKGCPPVPMCRSTDGRRVLPREATCSRSSTSRPMLLREPIPCASRC